MITNVTSIAKRLVEVDSGAQSLHPIVLLLRSAAGALLHWQERAFERSQLRELELHYLDDMGMTPQERDAEAGKPFWKA